MSVGLIRLDPEYLNTLTGNSQNTIKLLSENSGYLSNKWNINFIYIILSYSNGFLYDIYFYYFQNRDLRTN